MNRTCAPGRVGAVGKLEKAAAAGLGVYALDYAFGLESGQVKTPLGSYDAKLVKAILFGLGAAGEEFTGQYVPTVVSRMGGSLALDVTTRGIVPTIAFNALTSQRPGIVGGLKEAGIGYLGSTVGLRAADMLMAR